MRTALLLYLMVMVGAFSAVILLSGALDPALAPEPNAQTQFYLWDDRYDANQAFGPNEPNQVEPNRPHGKDQP